MTPEQLRQQHPECFDAIVAAERARVARHLDLGARCVDYKFSFACIRDGVEFTDQLRDQYADAIVNRRMVDVHQQESDAAEAILSGARRAIAKTAEEEVADELLKLMGPPPSQQKAM